MHEDAPFWKVRLDLHKNEPSHREIRLNLLLMSSRDQVSSLPVSVLWCIMVHVS